MRKPSTQKNKKINKSFHFIFGSIITGFICLMILIGFFYTPYDPDAMDATSKLQGISFSHLLGTDHLGRDLLSRIMEGSKTTFFVAFFTVLIGAVSGLILGSVSGYFGGILDRIIMGLNNVLFAFPSILLALVFIALLGTGKFQVVLALGIAFIPSFTRIVRGEVLRIRSMDYVENAKLIGVKPLRIIFVHILPNCKNVLLSSIMIGFNNAVLAEAGMSFLGIGVQPPDASLGRMLSEAQSYLFTSPMYVFFPGLSIILLVLGLSFLAEGISDKSH